MKTRQRQGQQEEAKVRGKIFEIKNHERRAERDSPNSSGEQPLSEIGPNASLDSNRPHHRVCTNVTKRSSLFLSFSLASNSESVVFAFTSSLPLSLSLLSRNEERGRARDLKIETEGGRTEERTTTGGEQHDYHVGTARRSTSGLTLSTSSGSGDSGDGGGDARGDDAE